MLLDREITTDEIPDSGDRGSFEPLPPGWYEAQIVSAELRTTKAGTGQYIAVRYDITSPAYSGRVVWGNINIRNQNPVAEEIGLRQLGDVMSAIGLRRVRDTDQLVGGQLKIKVTIRQSEQYGDSNEVKGVRALQAGSMPKAAPAAPAAQAGGKAPPPWQKSPAAPAPAQAPEDDDLPF